MKYIPQYFETLYRDEVNANLALRPILIFAESIVEDYPNINQSTIDRLKEKIEHFRDTEKEYISRITKEHNELFNTA